MSRNNVTQSLTMLTIGVLAICFTIIAEDETIPNNKHVEEAPSYYYIASTRRDLERCLTHCNVLYLGSQGKLEECKKKCRERFENQKMYAKHKSRENCIQECRERFQRDPEAFQNCRKKCLSQFPQSYAEARKECVDTCMDNYWRNRSMFLICRRKCYDKYPITL
ncbi:hypothetical protein PIB30_084626 [Stylosanthes scabra]|uniref:Uncharacterized protein n=1 Tax=Stylosanthes scabra TaxID=79078 RepID=A0ABU6XST5_9FABA|nr:hypothetical protein [Stylosanthes scabra]